MNKRNVVVFLIIIVLAALLLISNPKTIEYQKNYDATGEKVYGDLKVGQTFFSIDKNLYSINVMFAAPENKENSQEVIFHLRENGQEEDIRIVSANASEIQDSAFHAFKFEPIKESSGKGFYFLLESPNSLPENAVSFLYSQKDQYSSGNLVVNSTIQEGDIAFSATYRDSMLVRLLKSPLDLILLAVIAVILWIVLSRVFKEKNEEEDEE